MLEADDGEAKIRDAANWRDSARFSEEERVALDYAERMTTTGQHVDDDLFARLKSHFTEALENFRSKFNPPLGIGAQGFCLLPER